MKNFVNTVTGKQQKTPYVELNQDTNIRVIQALIDLEKDLLVAVDNEKYGWEARQMLEGLQKASPLSLWVIFFIAFPFFEKIYWIFPAPLFEFGASFFFFCKA